MSLWAIVPVKPLRRGKSRLAGALTEEERAALNQELLERTLKTLTTLKELDQVLVVSRDSHALTIARNHGAKTVQEDGQPHLNTALARASVIAPDRHHKGTNALLMVPANQIEYDFGEGSFQRHCERAIQSGARLEVVELPSLGLDLDVPEDLELIRKLEAQKV